MKKKIILTLLALFVFVSQSSGAGVENIGIIKGIWFSDTEFLEGETLRVYTAIQNNSGHDAEGTVEFFQDGVSLGLKNFSALDSRVIESWIDTPASPGEHKFSVKITELQKNPINGESSLVQAQSVFSERVALVKKDTDRDSIPDDLDEDDDGDGSDDEEEIEKGTDPLDKDSVPESEKNTNDSEPSDNSATDSIDSLKKFIQNLQDSIKDNSSDSNADKGEREQGKDVSDADSEKEASDSKDHSVGKDELISKTPDYVINISENSKLLRVIALELTKLQQSTHEYAVEIKENKDVKDTSVPELPSALDSSDQKSDAKDSTVETKEQSLSGFASWIYGIALSLFEYLSRFWWFMVVLLFFGIYLVLRIIFKLFSRKND